MRDKRKPVLYTHNPPHPQVPHLWIQPTTIKHTLKKDFRKFPKAKLELAEYWHCIYNIVLSKLGTSLVAQMVQNLPEMQEAWVQSLGRKDPLEKGTATHHGYSCLENFTDRGDWQATAHGVAKCWTRLS